MGIAKNAAEDAAGEIKQNVGAALGRKDMEESGHHEREVAQERELREQAEDGVAPTESENLPEGEMAKADFSKDSTYDVEDVTPRE